MSRTTSGVWKPCIAHFPGISFIGDGNQGFSRQDCLTFAQGVKSLWRDDGAA